MGLELRLRSFVVTLMGVFVDKQRGGFILPCSSTRRKKNFLINEQFGKLVSLLSNQ
jgi:hypothetical protein